MNREGLKPLKIYGRGRRSRGIQGAAEQIMEQTIRSDYASNTEHAITRSKIRSSAGTLMRKIVSGYHETTLPPEPSPQPVEQLNINQVTVEYDAQAQDTQQ